MPKRDLDRIHVVEGRDDPPPFAKAASNRLVRDLAAEGGLTDFVATHVVLFAVGRPERSTVHYPDIAMHWSPAEGYAAE